MRRTAAIVTPAIIKKSHPSMVRRICRKIRPASMASHTAPPNSAVSIRLNVAIASSPPSVPVKAALPKNAIRERGAVAAGATGGGAFGGELVRLAGFFGVTGAGGVFTADIAGGETGIPIDGANCGDPESCCVPVALMLRAAIADFAEGNRLLGLACSILLRTLAN